MDGIFKEILKSNKLVTKEENKVDSSILQN